MSTRVGIFVIAGRRVAVAVPTPGSVAVSFKVGVRVIVPVSVNVAVAVGVPVNMVVGDGVNVMVGATSALSVEVASGSIGGATDETRSARMPTRKPIAAANCSQRGIGCRVI